MRLIFPQKVVIMMKFRPLAFAGMLTLALTATTQTSAQTRWDFSGNYLASGINVDGTKYSKVPVSIVTKGNNYSVTWKLEGSVWKGVGTDIGNTFAVGYQVDGVPGVGIYKFNTTSGVLTGFWQLDDSDKEGTEVLTPVK
ncbi:MAG: hypothetical protein H7095_05050 [Pseudopedobacter sp.]|nr:hypothetical protein [Deinococcales bacterium]